MKKKYAILTISAGILIIAAVCTANFLMNRTVPEFTYNEPSEVTAPPNTGSSIPAENSDPSPENEDDPSGTDSIRTDMIMLCGDPLNSVYAEYDGAVLTISGTCPEDTDVAVTISSNSSATPATVRNGTEYSAKFAIDAARIRKTISLNVFFGGDLGITSTYNLFADENGIIDGGFSAISEINNEFLNDPSELLPEYTAEYILPEGTAEERSAILSQVQELSNKICEGIVNDYDKARALAQWVSTNIYYDYDARHDSVDMETVSLAHVLETHRTVCIGFANLYAALCSAQGITCCNVNGDALQGELDYEKRLEHTALHEWNVVIINGRKINVDTVWDTTNSYSGGQYSQGEVSRKFFDAGDIIFSQGHRARKTELRDYFG